jgi:uncharacterized repeat protein (TIGR01451 family)
MKKAEGVLVVAALLFSSLDTNYLSVATASVSKTASRAAKVQQTLSPELRERLTTTHGESLRVIVKIKSSRQLAPPTTRMTQAARASFVNALKAEAETSQSTVIQIVNDARARGEASLIRSFWIINGMAINATPSVIENLAARDDVASIEIDEWRQWIPVNDDRRATDNEEKPTDTQYPIPNHPFIQSSNRQSSFEAPPTSGDATWGIKKIRADKTWNALGIKGKDVSVAIIDSGVDWQHPYLRDNYRGLGNGVAPDHLHNWFDSTTDETVYPNDSIGHGTHVMGILVGKDGIGVAPEAQWMAVKGFNRSGFTFDSWLHSAFEFVLAPDGDTSYAPDILNCSWGNRNGGVLTFKDDLEVVRNAGIFVVFSNGNDGPAPITVGAPASYPNVIGVGATDDEDDIALFSSRGPSPIDNAIKPNLSAPGVKVLSSMPGGAFAILNGTSMASPHVAGTAALLLSANPSLDIAALTNILTRTAVPLSTTVPNNDSGWGRIDAYSATLSIMTAGVIEGYVRNGDTPVPNSQIVVNGSNGETNTTQTNAAGYYILSVTPGLYSVTASAFGFQSASSTPRLVQANQTTHIDLSPTRLPFGKIRGVARNAATGAHISAATISALNTPVSTILNDTYSLELPVGSYSLEARVNGFRITRLTVNVTANAQLEVNFDLLPTRKLAFVDTGPRYYESSAQQYREAFDKLELVVDEFRVKNILRDTPTLTDLMKYDTVIWSSPSDSPGLVGAGKTISSYLAAGKSMILSGNDIATYDSGDFGSTFYFSKFNALLADLNADSRTVTGDDSGFLSGSAFPITETVTSADPDVVFVRNPDYSSQVARFDNQRAPNGAAIYTSVCVKHRAAFFSFGLENIHALDDRAHVIDKTLSAFNEPPRALGVELSTRESFATGVAIDRPGSAVTHTLRIRHTGDAGVPQTFALDMSGNQWQTHLSANTVALDPCESAIITVTTHIPASAAWNVSDTINIRAVSQDTTQTSASFAFVTKTPSPVLFVDDDRFYDVEQNYLSVMNARDIDTDRWDTGWRNRFPSSPSVDFLKRYPIVVWSNGYDWFDPIKPVEQEALRQYLDAGGKLFFVSQAALAYTELSALNRNYFGVASIDFNDVTSNVVGMNDTPLGGNMPSGTLLPFPYSLNLSSSVQPMPNARAIFRGDSGQPFGLLNSGSNWRTAFLPFLFDALPKPTQQEVIERVLGWLSPLSKTAFALDGDVVQSGGLAYLPLDIELDSTLANGVPFSDRVVVSTTLSNGWQDMSASMPSLSTSSRAYFGPMKGGDRVRPILVARVDDNLPFGAPLTATVTVKLDQLGFSVKRQVVVRVGSPNVAIDFLQEPKRPKWGEIVSLKIRVNNVSGIDSPNVVITGIVPTGMTLLTPTIASNSTITFTANMLSWRGALSAGQATELNYLAALQPISPTVPFELHQTALVDMGFGDVQSRVIWTLPQTSRNWLPAMMKK